MCDTVCRHRRPTAGDLLVVGVGVGAETRCAHYDTDRDVIAIRFRCCGDYYPCFECHATCADHEAVPWPREQFDQPAVLCGVCGVELTIHDYLHCDHQCPDCGATFNPGCRHHADRYFEVEAAD